MGPQKQRDCSKQGSNMKYMYVGRLSYRITDAGSHVKYEMEDSVRLNTHYRLPHISHDVRVQK